MVRDRGRLTIHTGNAPLAQHDLSRVRARAVCLVKLNHSRSGD